MKTGSLALVTLTCALILGGCSRWNQEAGAFLDQGEFGNATRTNQLAQTCRKVTPANITKYGRPIASGCPGRLHDGKYAMFAYQETIESATEESSTAITETNLAIGE